MQNWKLLASAVAEILKVNPKFWKVPLVHGHAHFSSGCDFMMELGKPHLHAKFEVASFSHCVNTEKNLQILESSLVQGHTHFSSGCGFMMGPGKSHLRAKFEAAGFICYGHIWSKLALFRWGWVTLSPNFRQKRMSSPTIVGVSKLECFCCLKVKTT